MMEFERPDGFDCGECGKRGSYSEIVTKEIGGQFCPFCGRFLYKIRLVDVVVKYAEKVNPASRKVCRLCNCGILVCQCEEGPLIVADSNI